MNEKAMSIRIPESVHRQLRQRYIDTGQAMNAMVNEAIEQWLEKSPPEESKS